MLPGHLLTSLLEEAPVWVYATLVPSTGMLMVMGGVWRLLITAVEGRAWGDYGLMGGMGVVIL